MAYNESNNFITPSAFANIIGCNVKHLHYLEKIGKLKACRTPGGRRYYTKSELDRFLDNQKEFYRAISVIFYIRIPTILKNTKEGDEYADKAKKLLFEYAKKMMMVPNTISIDYASRFNLSRKSLVKIIRHRLPLNPTIIFILNQDDISKLPDAYNTTVDVLSSLNIRIINCNDYSLTDEISEKVSDMDYISTITKCT